MKNALRNAILQKVKVHENKDGKRFSQYGRATIEPDK